MMTDHNKSSIDEQQLLSDSRNLLQQQAEHLDMTTLMKLEKSRQRALDQPTTSRQINNDGSITLSRYLPGSLVALSMLLLLTFFTLDRDVPAVETNLGFYSDLELLGAKEPLELYQDIEFYEWLELDE